MFPSISRGLGTIKERTSHTIYFPYTNIEKMVSIKASCDCIALINDIPNQRLEIKYVAKVPEHLKNAGKRAISSQKSITVVFTSKTEPNKEQIIILGINATIVL